MYLKIIKFGSCYETYTYEKEPHPPIRYGKREPRERHRDTGRRAPANARRTRKAFIRIVRSNLGTAELPALVTLTMLSIVRIEVGYLCLTHFMAFLRRTLGKEFRYVAVPEFQKRGAVHFHILFWGLPQEIVQNETPAFFECGEIENERVGEIKRGNRTLQHYWALGFVDCVPTDGHPKLAGYLAKYMSKSMSDDRIAGQKAYACSRNIMRPLSFSSAQGFAELGEGFWSRGGKVLADRTYKTQWLGEAHYTLIDTEDSDATMSP